MMMMMEPPPPPAHGTTSAEQARVIAALQSGHNVVCQAVAGAGKTTMLLRACSALAGAVIQIVTYNKSLQEECARRLMEDADLRSRVRVHTYHALQQACTRLPAYNDKMFIANLGAALAAPPAYDYLFCDEAQDIKPQYAAFLLQLQRHCPAAGMLLVGDARQLLQDYDPGLPADERYMRLAPHIFGGARPWRALRLSVSFRTTPSIADFVAAVTGTRELEPGNVTAPDAAVQYVVANPYGVEVARHLEELIAGAGGPQNVLVLAPSVKHTMPIHAVINKLPPDILVSVSDRESGGGGSDTDRNKLRVSTYHGARGLEAHTVVVFGVDAFLDKLWRGKQPCTANALLVALTRSSGGRLVVVQDHRNEPLPPLRSYSRLVLNAPPVYFFEPEPAQHGARRWTVPDLVSHLGVRAMQGLMRHVVLAEAQPALPQPPPLQTLIDFVTHRGVAYTEDVSTLYGMAIPMCVEHELTGRCGSVEAILASSSVVYAADQSHVFPPSQRARVQAVYAARGRKPLLPADWMFLANACAAFGRYHYGLHQVQHFEWVDGAAFHSGCSALMATLRPPLVFQCAVEWQPGPQQPHMVVGRIDAIAPHCQQAWEFKFGVDVTDEHVLQLALYCAMLALKHPEQQGWCEGGRMFNARTGQLLAVRVSEPALLLAAALAQKTTAETTPHAATTDDEGFLAHLGHNLSELLCVT